MASCFFQRQGIYETSSQWRYILFLYPLTFTQLNRDCNWLILGHMALTKIKCITIVIHYSKLSNNGGTGGKWRDRRREKHCQFSFSRMNTTTQTRRLKLLKKQRFSEEEQQLVEEKDAENIRKVLCTSFIQWF